VSLIETVAAHERALAPWGFLETTHQQLYGNAKNLSPALQAIVVASRREVDTVLAISRRFGDTVEEVAARYFDEGETGEAERYEAVAWACGKLDLDPAIEDHLQDFKAAQVLLAKARDWGDQRCDRYPRRRWCG